MIDFNIIWFIIIVALEKFCNKYDTWEYKYDHFQEISDINPALQPEGYLIRFPFYIKGKRFAHILLSVTENPNEAKDSLYEIGQLFSSSQTD